ncbi:MAG: glycosyltransferase [Bacteroidales bacterium]|nr:glycosyltransferase [Bacteroidales bacterium]
MRIAILIPTIKPGGAEKQAALLAATLSLEHEVHFVSLYGKKNHSVIVQHFLEESRVSIHYLEGSFFKRWNAFRNLLKTLNIEVAFNYLTVCDVLGAIVEKLSSVKTVFNGIRNSRLAPAKMFLEWFAHNFIADYTIYNCHSGAKYFEQKGFNKKKSIIIPNCFPNISTFIEREDKKIKTIVTVGRFETQKDYLTAIKAIAELRTCRKDFLFKIIGHGHLEAQIRSWISEYDLSSYTSIYIAPANVQDIIKEADVYLSTSLFEGTSNSIMEAMNWSLPIVATNVGDNNILVKNNISGFLAEVGDYTTLAKDLDHLLSSHKSRLQMGMIGHENLYNFSAEVFKNNYLELLKTRI